MIKSSLAALRQFFQKEGYQAEIESGTEISPEQLVVLLGRDHDDQDLLLRLTLLDETTQPPLKEVPIHFLQLFLLFPYQIEESALTETSRLLMSINSSFDLAGFGMIEGTRLLYYRYIHMSENDFSEDILRALLDSMSMLLDAFLPSIKAVAKGEKNIEMLQKETKEVILSQEFEIL